MANSWSIDSVSVSNRIVVEYNQNDDSFNLFFIINGTVIKEPLRMPRVSDPNNFPDSLMELKKNIDVMYARLVMQV